MRCVCCDEIITRYTLNKHTREPDDLCSKCKKVALDAADDRFKVPEDFRNLISLTNVLDT
jgi:hypothetical protein